MSLTRLRKDALEIFYAGLAAADAGKAIKRQIRRTGSHIQIGQEQIDLDACDRVLVIGAGKASAAMAQAIEEIFGQRISEGIVNVKYGHAVALDKIRVIEAGHPVPDRAGMAGAEEIVRLLESTTEQDLVFCLISGGGSALLPLPADGISLENKQAVTGALLSCGATIHEINAVRKHISKVKGGQLARFAYPARLITLLLSDVIGDDLDVIASGPTVPDTSTFEDAAHFIKHYALWQDIPEAMRQRFNRGVEGKIPETPKAGDTAFAKTSNVIIGSNRLSVEAAEKKAVELGYHTLLLSTYMQGETSDVAKVHAAIAREVMQNGRPVPQPACIISGGETTVTLRGQGKGGRNQEFSLQAALELAGAGSVVVLSAGTDGTDGPTDAAGAMCDSETVARARKKDLDPIKHLAENNAYPFFDALDDLIRTGPTNTNVMDLHLVLIGSHEKQGRKDASQN